MGRRRNRVGSEGVDGSRVEVWRFQNGRHTMAPHLRASPPVHRASGFGAPSDTVRRPPRRLAPLACGGSLPRRREADNFWE